MIVVPTTTPSLNPGTTTIMQLGIGRPFRHPGGKDIYMMVQGGSIEQEAGSCVCVNLSSGYLYRYRLAKEIVQVNANVSYQGDKIPEAVLRAPVSFEEAGQGDEARDESDIHHKIWKVWKKLNRIDNAIGVLEASIAGLRAESAKKKGRSFF